MKTDTTRLSIQGVLLIFLTALPLISACTKQVVPEREGPAVKDTMQWDGCVTAPSDLRKALLTAEIEFIPSTQSDPIPVRVFGKDGIETPVIMAHGLQSHSGWFAQSAAFIAGLGHPVYSMDRRGSGLSQAARGDMKDFKEMVKDIHIVSGLVMQRYGKDKIYLLGHCFGAIPATAYACEYPEGLKGLLLTTPAIYTKTSIPFRYKLRILFSRPGRRDYMIPTPLEVSWFTELEEYEDFIREDTLSLRYATGDFYYQVNRARKFIRKNLDRLAMPVFLGIAGEDPICDNRGNVNFFDRLPSEDKTLVEYGDARHILEFSSAREHYFDDIACWLTRCEGQEKWQ